MQMVRFLHLFLLLAAPVLGQSATAQVRLCYGNVWSTDARSSTLTSKLSDVEALGGRAVRHGTGGPVYTGNGIPTARVVADSLRARGWTAILSINGRWRMERELTAEEVRAGGAAWGRFLQEYRDVYDEGAQVGNEVNRQMMVAYRRAGGGAAGEAAARQVAEQAVMLVAEFARGVKSTCPRCEVASGGLGAGPGGPELLALLAPHVRSGLVANVLNVHLYRAPRHFTRRGGRPVLNENLSDYLGRLLREAGWPAGTRMRAGEVNVRADLFGAETQAADALAALVGTLSAIPRMGYVCLFTPWPTNPSMTSMYGIRPGTRLGEAARAAARE